jgi:hypothetical protein
MDSPADTGTRAWTFDEFVREGLSLIPAYAPEWTNHNASDPGITLVELLAYFSEILGYRALRVTPDAELNFLRLLDGGALPSTDALLGASMADVEAAIGMRVQALSRERPLVTAHDFEELAVAKAAEHLAPGEAVRAMALVGADLRRLRGGDAWVFDAPADVTVVLAPEREMADGALERLCDDVRHALAPRCLLTTRVHVVGPVYLHVFVGCRLALRPGSSLADAMDAIDAALRRRFGPVPPDEPLAGARPFGRPLHVSELAETMDDADGVD